ncbi:MAG TPA: hypothetical protein VLD38_08150 [Nitrosopumilaceae archaeon]|nr:hypothetical protein [Nitrosopumilaceae archaeon]
MKIWLQSYFNLTIKITIMISLSLFSIPQIAFADDNDGGNKGFAIDLGWISIASGLLGNIPFVLQKRVKKYAVAKLGGGHEVTRELAMEHSFVMTVHVALNLIGFAAGMTHGLFFVKRLDAFSLSLAIMMTALTISGIILRFCKSINLKLATRMIHGQAILSSLLVLLVILHVFSYGDD